MSTGRVLNKPVPISLDKPPAENVAANVSTCTFTNSAGEIINIQPGPAAYLGQVASQGLLDILKEDVPTKRPIWTPAVINELDNLVASNRTISCPHYPHSAENLMIALGHSDVPTIGPGIHIGVISAISPWTEHVIRSAGATQVITVDFNPPILCGVSWIESKNVTTFNSENDLYDVLVSFSGIEHSGLGRYGDPIDPVGDIAALEHIHRALRPGGVLLLAIPTASKSSVEGIWHRLYGADRLAWLIEEKFDFKGRVWDGHIFGGWSDVDKVPKLFPDQSDLNGLNKAMNQHVLILKKPFIGHVKENQQVNWDPEMKSISLLNVSLLFIIICLVLPRIRRKLKGKRKRQRAT